VYAGRPRAVALTYIAAGGPSHMAARAAARTAGYRIAERTMLQAPFLVVDGAVDDYLRLRRHMVADLRRRRRRLEEHGRVSVGARDGTLDELVALEALGWKGARRTAIAARPSVQRFYADVVSWATARNATRMFALRLDGRPVAALLALEEHGVLHLLKTGYDPSFARFSPGRLLLSEAIAYAFTAGLRRVDLGGGTESYKMEWTQTVQDRVAVQCYAPGPVGDLARAVGTQARPLARRAGLDRLLRPARDRVVTLYDRARAPARQRLP
jgi:CelD/BcsL family acetyltransferase involved in cellulose biosynthesis